MGVFNSRVKYACHVWLLALAG